jgi:hypothetical protein
MTSTLRATFNPMVPGGLQYTSPVPHESVVLHAYSANDEIRVAATGDAQNVVLLNNDAFTGCQFMIPASWTVNFPVGTRINVIQTGTAPLTIVGEDGTTLNTPAAPYTYSVTFYAQFSEVTLLKIAEDEWVVNGDYI